MTSWNPKSMLGNIGSNISTHGGSVLSQVSSVKEKVSAGVSQGVSQVSGAIPNKIQFPKIPGQAADSTIDYELFSARHSPEVLRLLLSHFRIDEPTNAAVGLEEEDAIYAFLEWIGNGVKDKVSFVATDSTNGKIIALRLNAAHVRNKESAMGRVRHPPRMQKIIRLLEALNKDVYRTLPSAVPGQPASKVLKLEMVIVDPAYRRRGIAKTLLQMSCDLALRDQYEWITASATSFKTQAMLEKLGFKALRTITYADYTDPESGERPFATNMQPDDKCGKLMVRKPDAPPPQPPPQQPAPQQPAPQQQQQQQPTQAPPPHQPPAPTQGAAPQS